MSTIEKMKEKLASLNPTHLDIIDDSALHAGHAGAGQGGHYRLVIVSSQFRDMNAVSRHRTIYRTLGDMMSDQIHALSISAFAPEEF
jgi:BolA protein